MNEQKLQKGVPQKYIFFKICSTEYQADCKVKTFEKYQWRSSILLKLQAYGPQLILICFAET